MIRLRVWAGNAQDVQPLGWFGHAAAEYFFEYDEDWLKAPGRHVLAPQFPLGTTRFTGNLVRSYFENLLPEGTALEDVIETLSLRDPSSFELLGQLGKDLPGVISILPDDVLPDSAQRYVELPFSALSERLSRPASLLLSNTRATMSLAGAQEKMGVRFDARSGKLFESEGTTPSTHILKPDTRQKRYAPSAINEYACMQLARALKLPVPDTWLLRVPEAVYVVARYDRVQTEAGKSAGRQAGMTQVTGVHQLDGCQLLGHGPGWKYERQGALATLPKLVQVLRRLPIRGIDMLNLQRWVMFNYLIGNADAHAKNLSVLVRSSGYELAPFYDLLCVRAYGDADLALYIGDEQTFDAVGAHSWEALCTDCGFRLPETLRIFRKMAQDLLPAWAKTLAAVRAQTTPTPAEEAVLVRMNDVFHLHASHAMSMTAT